MPLNIRSIIELLDDILERAIMSDALKNAIIELRIALQNNDLELAYELATVKSFVTSKMTCPDFPNYEETNAFREDSKFNTEVLKCGSIYSYLDGVAFELSMKVGRLERGVVVFTEKGIIQDDKLYHSSPTLDRMKFEYRL